LVHQFPEAFSADQWSILCLAHILGFAAVLSKTPLAR
jgi:hypothetical protein